jgi:hypothetical protein
MDRLRHSAFLCQRSGIRNDALKQEDHHGESHADDGNKSRVRNQHPSLAGPAVVYLKLVVLTHGLPIEEGRLHRGRAIGALLLYADEISPQPDD